MKQANFQVISNDEAVLVIRDIGPWDHHPTITNDADGVVARLWAKCQISNTKRLYYYDSDGNMDELVHKDGLFIRFQPGHLKEVEE